MNSTVDPAIAAADRTAPKVPEQLQIQGYDRIFWLAYLSNGLTTVANAMLVRYADFVHALGGEERQLGLIVGCGMIGSICMRLGQGEAIDRYGASRVWRLSMVLYALSLLLHLFLTTAYGPAIFFVRVLMQSSLAGVFGSSITFVSLRVPPYRMAEMIGTLGTSGFVGLMLGPLLGDWLSGRGVPGRAAVEQVFLVASTFAAAAAVATWFATRYMLPPRRRRRPPLAQVLRRYAPGMLSLTAAAMGAGFSIPMTFLRPFAVEARIAHVGFFFLVYACTAFAARMATRSWFQRFGNRPWITAGLTLLTASFLCYIPITRTWQLAFPALLAGIAHALLFPSVIAAGTAVFPRRYLGVATSLMLAMFDVGTFIGAPVIGTFLLEAKQHTSAAYPWMFAATSGCLALVTALFCIRSIGKKF